MSLWIEHGLLLAIMAAMLAASAFLSGSETALFYLRRQDRRAFREGSAAQRTAARLLDRPDQLLSAVLFWNLLVNTTYFALASIIGLSLEAEDRHAEAGAFSLVALLLVILFGEMLPKTIAVWRSTSFAALVAYPIAMLVRSFRPIVPVLNAVLRVSRRLFLPSVKPEAYLELGDLERAIAVSKADAHLLAQEQAVLESIVMLSDMHAEELMRPRTQFSMFRPPVKIEHLGGRIPQSGYLLVAEPDSEEVAAAIPLKELSDLPEGHLEFHAVPVLIVPWCAPVAKVLEDMRRQDRHVAAVVNELGETVGIITIEDVLATIFTHGPARETRLLRMQSIEPVDDNTWHVTGMTSLKRVGRYLGERLPETQSLTVAGMLQEVLQRFPVQGDRCQWGPFEWEVLSSFGRGRLKIAVRLAENPQPEEGAA